MPGTISPVLPYNVEKMKAFENFESPLKALGFNFRFNQFFGIFPGRINEEWTEFVIVKKLMFLTFSIKAMFLSIIFTLMYIWLNQQDIDFNIFIERISHYPKFTTTDTFAMIAHFLFLQFSALTLFFNNLNLGPELTYLANLVIEYNSKYQGTNPSAKKLFRYRISVCILCTIASAVLFTGVWRIVANPDRSFGGLDFAIIFSIVVALYVENQNHMFSELLFLRFTDILDDRFNNLMDHMAKDHGHASKGRPCCVDHSRNIHNVFRGIGQAFGFDLLVAVTILVISITFGLYLVLTFSIFIGITEEPVLFSVYVLYSIIPSIRLYVLAEGAQKTQGKMLMILNRLRQIEASEETDSWTSHESKQFALARMNFQKPKGYDAAGFFFLNRKFMSGVFGALVTYLIVLLQFKLSDNTIQEWNARL